MRSVSQWDDLSYFKKRFLRRAWQMLPHGRHKSIQYGRWYWYSNGFYCWFLLEMFLSINFECLISLRRLELLQRSGVQPSERLAACSWYRLFRGAILFVLYQIIPQIALFQLGITRQIFLTVLYIGMYFNLTTQSTSKNHKPLPRQKKNSVFNNRNHRQSLFLWGCKILLRLTESSLHIHVRTKISV